jgi:DNA-binding response OmpR family regulator
LSVSQQRDDAPARERARGKTRILLIDDEPLVREELGALLADEGYEVITGADGEEGLSLFRQEAPDMVITDVRMPRRDGLSVAMIIRQEDPWVPVTVITGHGTESMAIEALRAGVTDFVKKPVRIDDLIAALGRMEAARQPEGVKEAELPPAVALLARSWTYQIQNDREAIPSFVDVLLKRASGGLDRMAVLELSLALRELVLNAVEHGNLELTYEEKTRALESGTLDAMLAERAQRSPYRERSVTVSVERQDRKLTIAITDQGKGFDWRSLPDPTDPANLLLAHGRGVLLARLSVDSLGYSDRGDTVKVVKIF